MTSHSMPEIIRKKRDGERLSLNEISYFVRSCSEGRADLSQIGAILMAIYKCGLSDEETFNLTSCMVDSGIKLTWPGIVVDKHSTGGVGDKVSLPLVPALAALGLTVPMISGRGLGWTGGTLDKLESIPGYQVELSRSEMQKSLEQCSAFISATTNDICPADKILYKIRDITSTVDNISLIAGSILSKKIAAGVKHLILDIKVGKGAFMKTPEEAEELARKMISVSKSFSMKTRALLTRMDEPIGKTIGNTLEIEETIDTLLNKGPKDLVDLVKHLGGELLHMSGKVDTVDKGKEKIAKVIADGSALDSFLNILLSQGVPSNIVTKLGKGYYSILPQAKHTTEVTSKSKGYVSSIDSLNLGKMTWKLGAGRSKPTDKIDHSVGIRLHKLVGDKVEIGEILMTIYHCEPIQDVLINDLINSVEISNQKILPKNIIIKSIS